MSDSKPQAQQRTIDYMVRLLQMNPVHQGDEIVRARTSALRLAKKVPQPSAAVEQGEPRAERRKLLEQLEAIRAEFWTMPLATLQSKLSEFCSEGFADVEAAAAKLRVVAAHRAEFPKLAEKPGFDGHFFASLKPILIDSPRDAAVLKEKVVSLFRDSSQRKRGRRMVRLLKNELPPIYQLEADWFATLQRQKTFVARTRVRSTAAAVGSRSGGGYGWVIGIVLISLARLATNVSENNYKPGGSTTSKRFYLPSSDQPSYYRPSADQKARELQKQVPFELDKRVWEPYQQPSPDSREQSASPRPFNTDYPFPQPKIFDPGAPGPGAKPDDRYSR
jgi:hypothetical protein